MASCPSPFFSALAFVACDWWPHRVCGDLFAWIFVSHTHTHLWKRECSLVFVSISEFVSAPLPSSTRFSPVLFSAPACTTPQAGHSGMGSEWKLPYIHMYVLNTLAIPMLKIAFKISYCTELFVISYWNQISIRYQDENLDD